MNNKLNISLITLILIAFIGSFLFYLPILNSLHSLGIQDWDQNFAWNEFTRLSIIKYHQFPFWDPFRCGGAAHFANPQISVVSIQTLLVLIFGTVVGIKISIFVHGLIGFIGFYLLSKQYGLSKRAAIIASTVFSFNGALSSSLSTGMVPFIGIAYAPYILYFYNKGSSNKWLVVASGLFAASYYFGYHSTILLGVFIAIYSISVSILEKSLRPIKKLLIFALLFIIFSAPKLILSLQLLSVFPRYLTDISGYHLSHLLYFLLSQKQGLIINTDIEGFSFGIDENSLYVGVIPVFLFLLFFLKNKIEIRKHMPLLVSLLVVIILMLGSYLPFSLYDTLRNLTFFSSFRIAQRFRFDFIILFALIAGLGFDRLSRLIKNSNYKSLLYVSIAVIIYIDLTTFSSMNFFKPTLIINDNFPRTANENISQHLQIDYRDELSYRTNIIPKYLENTKAFSPWSYEYVALQNSIGVINCYDSITDKTYAAGNSSPDYRGEWYVENGSKSITKYYWSPNSMAFNLININDTVESDVFIINQNYYPGWYVDIDGKLHQAENYKGLLSIKVTKDDNELIFKFLPYRGLFQWLNR